MREFEVVSIIGDQFIVSVCEFLEGEFESSGSFVLGGELEDWDYVCDIYGFDLWCIV